MYAFIDTETTGFDSIRNQVLTLSCFVTDASYRILGEHHGKFRPDGDKKIVWSDGAEAIHGITWQEAINFPTISEASESFISFLKGFGPLTFVAHNTPYDRRMLKGTLSRVDMHFDMYQLFSNYEDTVKLVKESGLVSSKSKSLGAICKELGIEHNHHDAKSDAYVLIEIHKRCKNKQKSNTAQWFVPEHEPNTLGATGTKDIFMSNELSIKETKEAIAALKLATISVKHIVKGGVAAIPAELMALAPNYNVFVEGYKGAENIKAELMDLSKEEIIDLFVTIFDGVKEVEKA